MEFLIFLSLFSWMPLIVNRTWRSKTKWMSLAVVRWLTLSWVGTSFPSLALLAPRDGQAISQPLQGSSLPIKGPTTARDATSVRGCTRQGWRLPCSAVGAQYDGINVTRSTAFEHIKSRRLLLEEGHKDDLSRPIFEHAQFFMAEDESAMLATFRASVAEIGDTALVKSEKLQRPDTSTAKPSPVQRARLTRSSWSGERWRRLIRTPPRWVQWRDFGRPRVDHYCTPNSSGSEDVFPVLCGLTWGSAPEPL